MRTAFARQQFPSRADLRAAAREGEEEAGVAVAEVAEVAVERVIV